MGSQEFITLGVAPIALGIVSVENQLIGYSFIGVGVLLSIISATKLGKKSKTQSNRIGGE